MILVHGPNLMALENKHIGEAALEAMIVLG